MDPGDGRVLQGKKVLIVEDQFLVAEDLRRSVSALGAVVCGPVPNLRGARLTLRGEDVDLALLDINLGPETVYALAEELSDMDVPFIFTTGYDGSVLPERYQDRPRLEKPVTADSLRGVLQGRERDGSAA